MRVFARLPFTVGVVAARRGLIFSGSFFRLFFSSDQIWVVQQKSRDPVLCESRCRGVIIVVIVTAATRVYAAVIVDRTVDFSRLPWRSVA